MIVIRGVRIDSVVLNFERIDLLVVFVGWRFVFRYYFMWMSFFGVLFCIVVMFIMNWWIVFIIFVIVCIFFVYVYYFKLGENIRM